jgi:hypothetical protein
MKRLLAASLAASLLANAGLVAWVVRRGEAVATKSSSGTGTAFPTVGASAPAVSIAIQQPAAPEPPRLWEQLEGENARSFALRLRAAGVPDRTGRLLVTDALRRQYLERQRQLIGSTEPADFWKTAAAAADRDRQSELRALAREHRDLLAAVYGGDEGVAADRERERRLYGPLPDEKLDRVDRIHADYGEMAEDIRVSAGSLLLPTDRETLALLEQERRKDVAAILTAEELELYDLQTSATARTLRARLAAFAPTEREFRAFFALQRDFDERFGPGGIAPDDGRQRERASAEVELNARIRAALGETRYEEYRKTQDAGYRMAARIAERFGLPTRRAGDVFALSRATQARLATMRDDKTLTLEAAHLALTELSRETGSRLTALLGAEGAELYKQTSCGAWLRALERTAQEEASGARAAEIAAASVPGVPAAPAPLPETKGEQPGKPAPEADPTAAAAAPSTVPAIPQGASLPLAAQPNG